MTEGIIYTIVYFLTGLLSGTLYFSTLDYATWFFIRKNHNIYYFILSFILRTSLLLYIFYLIIQNGLAWLFPSIFGFIAARYFYLENKN